MRNINFLSKKNHLLVMTLLQTKLILASTSTESKILNDSKKKNLLTMKFNVVLW